MSELDTPPSGRMPEDAEQRLRQQLAAHQHDVREVLSDLLAASHGNAHTDDGLLVEICAKRVPDDKAPAWGLAVLAFEDRAVQLAESWLDDPQFDPAQRERVSGLLSDLPGYRDTRGLDDEVLEQGAIDQHEHDPTPRPVSVLLGFVLSILILAQRSQNEVDHVLIG